VSSLAAKSSIVIIVYSFPHSFILNLWADCFAASLMPNTATTKTHNLPYPQTASALTSWWGCACRATPFPKALADLAEALPRSMGTHTPRALTTRRPAPQRPRHPLTHQLHTPLHHTHTQASVAALALRLPSSPPAHDTQTHHPPASSGTILHPTALASSNPRPRLELPPRSAP